MIVVVVQRTRDQLSDLRGHPFMTSASALERGDAGLADEVHTILFIWDRVKICLDVSLKKSQNIDCPLIFL